MNIGWIDFSKEERNKTLTLLHILQEVGAVDELGIGVVRDAFADKFFPGTSTLLTRAKYFLIVPYIVQEKIEEACKNNWTTHKTLEEVNKEERRFAESIWKLHRGEEKLGLIGANALSQNRWVKRSPSELYWNGIRTLGICGSKGLSLKQYISEALEHCHAKGRTIGTLRRGENNDGDDIDAGSILGFKPLNINSIYKKGWIKSTDISLTKEEAKYLCKKIKSNINNTVFATSIKHGINLEIYEGNFFSFAEDISKYVDDTTKNTLDYACYFARVIYAARVRYNMMLKGDRNNDAQLFWEIILDEGIPETSLMNELLITLHPKGNSMLYNQAATFLLKLADYFHKGDWTNLDNLIKEREKGIKGPERAKLMHPEKYDAENWVGGKYLDYRLPNAARIITDIYEGLKK